MNIGIIHAYPNRDNLASLKNYFITIFVPFKDAKTLMQRFHNFSNIKIYPINFEETLDTIQTIAEVARRDEISCFLPLYEGGIILSALVSLELGLQFYSLTSSLASRNKYYLKLIMQSAFINTPESIPVFPYTPYRHVEELLGEKFVLKIVDSMNSQAIIVVNNEQEYTRYLKMMFQYLENSDQDTMVDRNRFCYGNDIIKVIAQEFCEGKEINIDVLINKSQVTHLGIFEKANTKGPFFPESVSFYPSTLNKNQQNEILAIATKAAAAMQIQYGVAHIEIRYKDNIPMVIDMGLRPGGAYTVRAIRELCGMDLILEVAKIMTGGGSVVEKYPFHEKAILYGGIIFDKTGYLQHIGGIDKIEMPELKDLTILAKEGDRVVAPPFSSQPHLCYYFLQGMEIEKLLAQHSYIQDSIHVQIG